MKVTIARSAFTRNRMDGCIERSRSAFRLRSTMLLMAKPRWLLQSWTVVKIPPPLPSVCSERKHSGRQAERFTFYDGRISYIPGPTALTAEEPTCAEPSSPVNGQRAALCRLRMGDACKTCGALVFLVVEVTSLTGRPPVVPHPRAELRGLQRVTE